jgi:hypothetical protein
VRLTGWGMAAYVSPTGLRRGKLDAKRSILDTTTPFGVTTRHEDYSKDE